MKLNPIIILIACITHLNCGKRSVHNTVSFNLEGTLFIKELGKYQNSNGYVTINNNLDSTIYVPTDSLHKYFPPYFYSYQNVDGEEISPIHPGILKESYCAIAPHSSQKFMTIIMFIPDKENPSRKMSFTYVYTTKNEGSNSQWISINQKYIYNERHLFRPY